MVSAPSNEAALATYGALWQGYTTFSIMHKFGLAALLDAAEGHTTSDEMMRQATTAMRDGFEEALVLALATGMSCSNRSQQDTATITMTGWTSKYRRAQNQTSSRLYSGILLPEPRRVYRGTTRICTLEICSSLLWTSNVHD
jgi:hypothetical protein